MGIPFYGIFTGKLRRYFDWRNFIAPFFVFVGFFQALYLLIRFWPDAVFVKGGFVSLPVALAAFILRRPLILHESDSLMGLANRITACLARKVCLGFPLNTESGLRTPKFIFTGNPVRTGLLLGDRQTGFNLTGFHEGHPIVLFWGGSQGAQEINEMVERHFMELKRHFQIIHVTGFGKKTDLHDSAYRSFEYLGPELPHIYAITDFVVGRAGANSLYEIALMEKPNILMPLKSSAHNHQALNAEYFENEGASIVLTDANKVPEILLALWENKEKQQEMVESLRRVARPDAAKTIADLILSVS